MVFCDKCKAYVSHKTAHPCIKEKSSQKEIMSYST